MSDNTQALLAYLCAKRAGVGHYLLAFYETASLIILQTCTEELGHLPASLQLA